jgi:hypothetical protein
MCQINQDPSVQKSALLQDLSLDKQQAFSLDRMEAPAQWAITSTVTSISPISILLLYYCLGAAS